MKQELVQIGYDMWFNNQTKFFRKLDLPYLKDIKRVYWEDCILLTFNKQRVEFEGFFKGLERAIQRDSEEEFIKEYIKNRLLMMERCAQIYLDPTDKLHEREVERNGSFWNGIVTKAKRNWVLRELGI